MTFTQTYAFGRQIRAAALVPIGHDTIVFRANKALTPEVLRIGHSPQPSTQRKDMDYGQDDIRTG